MSRYLRPFALLPLAALSCIVDARPYPLGTGMAASADSAQTASSNPAGISRFAERAMSAEILFFNSESEWESEFSGIGNRFDTKDSGETVVAGDDVAHFSGLWEFTVVEVLAAAGQHWRSPRT